jgi:hypothetical protein
MMQFLFIYENNTKILGDIYFIRNQGIRRPTNDKVCQCFLSSIACFSFFTNTATNTAIEHA